MSISAPSATGLPVIDQATEPAAVRHGGPAAQKAYKTGLGFEQMLVSELTQTMTDTISGSDPSGGDSSGGDPSSSGSSSGLGPYASLMPGALSSSIMSAGGTGVAMQIARSIDPSLDGPSTPASRR